MSHPVLAQYHSIWNNEEFKKTSEKNKNKRNSDCGGMGPSLHTGGGVKKGGYMLGFGSDTQHYFPEVARRKKSRNGESSSHVACDEKFEQLDQTNKEILENQKNIMGLLQGIYSAHPELVEYVALTADSNQSGDVGLDNVAPTTDSNQSGDVGLDNLSMDDDTQSPA
nr:putative transposase En/Spm [Ipomoea batatas]